VVGGAVVVTGGAVVVTGGAVVVSGAAVVIPLMTLSFQEIFLTQLDMIDMYISDQ
jgi:hypothetical protein